METKDRIEELILNSLDGLSENEPFDGHFERFEAKLKAGHKKRKITFGAIWKVAAAVIFVLLATNQAYIYLSPNPQNPLFNATSTNSASLSSVSPEYKEVEFYFTNAITLGLDQWENLKTNGSVSAEEQELMDSELSEFEERFESLQKDLVANPNDRRVINAMLDYYRAKLSVITIVVNKLEEINKKNNNYETNI